MPIGRYRIVVGVLVESGYQFRIFFQGFLQELLPNEPYDAVLPVVDGFPGRGGENLLLVPGYLVLVRDVDVERVEVLVVVRQEFLPYVVPFYALLLIERGGVHTLHQHVGLQMQSGLDIQHRLFEEDVVQKARGAAFLRNALPGPENLHRLVEIIGGIFVVQVAVDVVFLHLRDASGVQHVLYAGDAQLLDGGIFLRRVKGLVEEAQVGFNRTVPALRAGYAQREQQAPAKV